ncbi:hypothetical protein Ahy_B05g074197 [Arachis hypogaea]|uniref:Uncharacterized protein n=1 Tax=Arachis hypogaea TaxID=3818 RepID=A0A444YY56_ARAHY|nr:hypothetical protein Ahy_B05g074197 [Arachis hypogaea]
MEDYISLNGLEFDLILDFTINNNDASVFLDAQHCCIMKTSLDYLSSLSANDGLSGAMRAFCTLADNLKSDLENNKNQFPDTVATEKVLRQKLVCLEEMKEDLEKQIRIMNANIITSRKEQKEKERCLCGRKGTQSSNGREEGGSTAFAT